MTDAVVNSPLEAAYGGPVRWEALFADLEAQLAAGGEEAAQDGERARAEVARTELVDRLRAGAGAPVRLRLVDGSTFAGVLHDAGTGWLLLADGPSRVVVPTAALAAVSGLSRAVAPPAGQVARRLGLPSVLRALARDRAAVRLHLPGQVLSGTIDRVAADHLDLAEHPVGEARRPGAVREVLTVPLRAVVAVRSTP
jgi:hypothetical protein